MSVIAVEAPEAMAAVEPPEVTNRQLASERRVQATSNVHPPASAPAV